MRATGAPCNLIHRNRIINGGGRAINVGGATGFEFFRPPLSTNALTFDAENIRVIANLFSGWDAPISFVGRSSLVFDLTKRFDESTRTFAGVKMSFRTVS